MLKCKTGGQPITFMKVAYPRKLSSVSKSPLKRKRARETFTFRKYIAGAGGVKKKQSAELKILHKKARLEVCHEAGVTQKAELSSKTRCHESFYGANNKSNAKS